MTGSGPVGWRIGNRKKMARKMEPTTRLSRREKRRKEREDERHKEGARGLLGEQEAAGTVSRVSGPATGW